MSLLKLRSTDLGVWSVCWVVVLLVEVAGLVFFFCHGCGCCGPVVVVILVVSIALVITELLFTFAVAVILVWLL